MEAVHSSKPGEKSQQAQANVSSEGEQKPERLLLSGRSSSSLARKVLLAAPKTSPQTVLQLQRTIGNKAVTKLLAEKKAMAVKSSPALTTSSAIQRYTLPSGEVENKLNEPRLSNTAKSFRATPHGLFAEKPLIEQANAALKTAGGQDDKGATPGAFLRLLPTDPEVAHQTYPELVKVGPVVAKRATTLAPTQSPRKAFLEKNGPGLEYVSPADCHVAAQTVMGSDDMPSGLQDTEKAVIADDGDGSKTIDSSTHGGKHMANRAKHGFFEDAMPRFSTHLKTLTKGEDKYKKLAEEIDTASGTERDFGDNNSYAKIYRDKILPDKELYDAFTTKFHINEAVVPVVGQAFSNINDEAQKDKMEKEGKDIWNFHWAGVVMVDGADYITLENLSVENLNEMNTNWYYQMYGPAEQSFHTEALKDSHATPAALTMSFKTIKQVKHVQPTPFVPSTGQKIALGWFTANAATEKSLVEFEDELKALDNKLLTDPKQTLRGIWQKLGYDSNQVTAENFKTIKDLLTQIIQERALPTTAPVKKVVALPRIIPLPTSTTPDPSGILEAPPL